MYHFLKEVRMKTEDGYVTLEEIPRRSMLKVVELPSHNTVFEGVVSGSWAGDLDEGKYRYIVRKVMSDDGKQLIRGDGDFLVGCTEQEAATLARGVLKPKHSKAMQTSEGVRWTCDYPGCGDHFTSKNAALIHEGEVHYRIKREDILKDPSLSMLKIRDTASPKPEDDGKEGKTIMKTLRKKAREQAEA